MSRPERFSAADSPATRQNGRVSPLSPTGQRKLTLTLHERGTATVLHVDGDIDLATVPALRDEALKQLQRTPDLLVLDFGDVGFLASAGLATLTTLLDATEPHTQLRIVAGPIAFRAIELSGLASELALFPTLDDALTRH